MRKNIQRIAYIGIFLFLCMIPSAGLLFSGSEVSSENRRLAALPEFWTEEGEWNQEYLSGLGAYFEDHFAFRNEWVTALALLEERVFGVSSVERVIAGTDHWLFYRDSLEDYQGSGQMTERQLFDTAHTLAMIQSYVTENGAAFVFTAAPNKNSLYGEFMPYYYQYFREEEKNLDRLLPWLSKEGVHYADVYGALAQTAAAGGTESQELLRVSDGDMALYHERDSHWNNQGAAIGADAILNALNWPHESYSERAFVLRRDFIGDLDEMLYPAATTSEMEIYYDPQPRFDYLTEASSNFDPQISTMSPYGTGSLVMYRDSFGNALLPYMAEAFEKAYFSRGIPYSLSDLFTYEANVVVIERAERFLPDLARHAPVIQGPVASGEVLESCVRLDEFDDFTIETQGLYTVVTGTLPEDGYETDSRIYIRVNDLLVFEAFPVSYADGTEGFSLAMVSSLLQESENRFEVWVSRKS